MFRLAVIKALALLRQEGVTRAVAWVLSSAFRVQRFTVFECDVRQTLPPIPRDPEIEVKLATPEELRQLRRSHPSLPVAFFYDEIYGLSTCFLTFFQRRVAKVDWLALPGEYNRYFDLQPGEAEVFQVHVLPEFRSLPLSRSLNRNSQAARLRWLLDHGYEREYARVPATIPTWSRIVGARYRRVGTLTHFAFCCPKFRRGDAAP